MEPLLAKQPPVLPSLLGRMGNLEVRLASSRAEIAAAQNLRMKVFGLEFGAGLPQERRSHDEDLFDEICDHLIVIDTALNGPDHERIVGTYRCLRQDQAATGPGFYSNQEFETETLIRRHTDRRFLELGRSCVLQPYRSKRTIELLWQGIWAYCSLHAIDVMIGCASFKGTIPAAHALPLSFLAHFCVAENEWLVQAIADRGQNMDLMPREAVNFRLAMLAMPPLIKGYIRLGARFGNSCVIDNDFGTVDVFVVLPRESIANRYLDHYGEDATRFAA